MLVADNDNATFQLISELLEPHGDISVLTAPTGGAVIDMLNESNVDLIVAGGSMKVKDGMPLYAYLGKTSPNLTVFIITDHDFPEHEPAPHVFTRPLNADSFAEKIIEELAIGSEGQIHSMSLPSFLQLVQIENKTCTLTIAPRDGAIRGKLYFVDGELYAAEANGLDNENAVREILGWERPSIFINNTCKVKEKAISRSLENYLLTSGSRENDGGSDEKDSVKIIAALDRDPGVLEYGLYNDRYEPMGNLNGRPDPFGSIKISAFFRFLETFGKSSANSGNTSLLLNTTGGRQIAVFRKKDFRIIVSLKVGYTIDEIMARIDSPGSI